VDGEGGTRAEQRGEKAGLVGGGGRIKEDQGGRLFEKTSANSGLKRRKKATSRQWGGGCGKGLSSKKRVGQCATGHHASVSEVEDGPKSKKGERGSLAKHLLRTAGN